MKQRLIEALRQKGHKL
ncbi:hypothetical protein GA0061098_1003282 [Bradyrhizobium shewense]|uniref:Uncharacterized protein n=1 Tax=Bradyrhizobium shewense TaxID=1761772 RepID=A0A1C3V653_9BRAD|nr:hypothetical protein GA0061098_1003282 [Bradyrhizobium shewense]